MTIPTVQYKGHELRAYAHQTHPLYRDPYAAVPRRYDSVVRIDTIPSGNGSARRYKADFAGVDPSTFDDAIERAMRYAKDIVDGRVHAQEL